jgi:excisionase family DNA binding protein
MKHPKKKDIEQEWGKVPTIARYAGLSPRTVRNLIRSGEIRYARLSTGTIMIKISWIDEYLEAKEIRDTKNETDKIIDDVLAHFTK